MDQAEEHAHQIQDQFTRQAKPFAQGTALDIQNFVNFSLLLLKIGPPDDLLDVACGPGVLTCALAPLVRSATGIDVVPAMIEQARARQAELNLTNVEWHQGDAARLPFADGAFSAVVTRYSFHHMLDPAAAFREMVRVCRPGGLVGVADVAPDACKAAAYDDAERLRDPSHTRALPREELYALARGTPLIHQGSVPYNNAVPFEAVLARSFPREGDAAKLRKMIREDIGVDRLSFDAQIRDGEVYINFPVWLSVWKMPSREVRPSGT